MEHGPTRRLVHVAGKVLRRTLEAGSAHETTRAPAVVAAVAAFGARAALALVLPPWEDPHR